MNKLYGVGINDKSIQVNFNGRRIKEYTLWNNILKRCYNTSYHIERPTYSDCTLSENFKNFNYFYQWCQNKIGFRNQNWQLDKDILLKGNKIYHEDLCVFVPPDINGLFIKSNATRGNLPIGVSLHYSGKYIAQCKNTYIGIYLSSDEAFRAYKAFKENLILTKALQYQNHIDIKLYNAMLNYEVSIND